jgi:magnesium-dependent phosphatase 1
MAENFCNTKTLVNEAIVRTWNELKNKPKCIVFDLDYTLWPFIVGDSLVPSFTRKQFVHNGIEQVKVYDHQGKEAAPHKDVIEILKSLKSIDGNLLLAIASRSKTPSFAMSLIEHFDWKSSFDSVQIYPGTKQKHLSTIKKELKITHFKDFLFFDDDKLNINQANSLGVCSYQVTRRCGLNIDAVLNGLKQFDLNYVPK